MADPTIQRELAQLDTVPASQLQSVTSSWQALDRYVADRAYLAVVGYRDATQLYSTRVDPGAAIFHPVYGADLTSLALKWV